MAGLRCGAPAIVMSRACIGRSGVIGSAVTALKRWVIVVSDDYRIAYRFSSSFGSATRRGASSRDVWTASDDPERSGTTRIRDDLTILAATGTVSTSLYCTYANNHLFRSWRTRRRCAPTRSSSSKTNGEKHVSQSAHSAIRSRIWLQFNTCSCKTCLVLPNDSPAWMRTREILFRESSLRFSRVYRVINSHARFSIEIPRLRPKSMLFKIDISYINFLNILLCAC